MKSELKKLNKKKRKKDMNNKKEKEKKKKKNNNFILSIFFCIIVFFTIKIVYKKIFIKKKKKRILHYNRTEIIDEYLASIPSELEKDKEDERKSLEKYIFQATLSPSSFIEAKENLSQKFYYFKADKSTPIQKVVLCGTYFPKFGNKMVILNNLIYYCELFGIKEIYLNPSFNWFLNNPIITPSLTITPMKTQKESCEDNDSICIRLDRTDSLFLFYQNFVKPEIRLSIIKDEIKRNLPKVETLPDELYIHIRSGDVFAIHKPNTYAQPPLCFYEKVLNNFQFSKIFILSETDNNPVINKLTSKYKNISFKRNNIEVDISRLVNAYNIIGSVSSFYLSSIKFNDNLQNLWEYDIYRRTEKIRHLHHDFFLYPIKYKIYTMKPSERYKNEMFLLKNTPEQQKLMIEETCNNEFIIFNPNDYEE